MEFEYSSTAGAIVQSIHILRDQSEVRFLDFEFDERAMPRIRQRLRDGLPAPVIPLPDQARVAQECFGRGKILGLVVFPKALVSPERRHAAFGGNSCAGEHRYFRGCFDPLTGFIHMVIMLKESRSAPACGVEHTSRGKYGIYLSTLVDGLKLYFSLS